MNRLSVSKRAVVDLDDLRGMSPIFRSGEWIARGAMRALQIDNINDLYSKCCDTQGSEFAQLILAELGITLRVDNEYHLDELCNGRFVTVSNHPFGALDGVVLIKLIGERFPEFKVMVNMVLGCIGALNGSFIAVDPHSKNRAVTMRGIRAVMANIRNGNPVGFFPSGAVSRMQPTLRVRDRAWQQSVIRLIQQVNVPVIPIHFYGGNSVWFNLLGMVDWRLRSLLLPSEVFRKRGSVIHLAIGKPITVQELECYKDNSKELGEFLRKRTYSI